jgi:hypothetical protein
MEPETHTFTRRRFLQYTGALGALAGLKHRVPASARPDPDAQASAATRPGAHPIALWIRQHTLPNGARQGPAVTINCGGAPGIPCTGRIGGLPRCGSAFVGALLAAPCPALAAQDVRPPPKPWPTPVDDRPIIGSVLVGQPAYQRTQGADTRG